MGFFSKLERFVVDATQKIFSLSVRYEYWADSATEDLEGVFNREWVSTNGVTTVKPTLRIIKEDLKKPPTLRDRVQISGNWYKVNEWREDGHGGLILILNKV